VPGEVKLTITANSSRFLRFGRLLLALCAFAGFALADGIPTIDATGVNGNQGGGLWMNENGAPVDQQFAGVIDIKLTQNGQDTYRETLCVDLFTDIYIGRTYDTWVVLPSQVPTSDPEKELWAVSWLIDNALLPDLYPQGNFTSSLLPQYLISSSDTSAGSGAQRGEAIQFAIWDMTVDGGDGFSDGKVAQVPGSTDPVVLADAIYYENAARGMYTNNAYVYINWTDGDGSPAQMLEGPLYFDNGPKPIVPEPATFVLVGVALIGASWSWRRRVRKSGSSAA
jgi:hypothetical protein